MTYKVIIKPKSFMKDYIAMHGELPKRERPDNMKHMPKHTIYIREDVARNKTRENRVLLHEYREMKIMEAHPGISYKHAHKRAGY